MVAGLGLAGTGVAQDTSKIGTRCAPSAHLGMPWHAWRVISWFLGVRSLKKKKALNF